MKGSRVQCNSYRHIGLTFVRCMISESILGDDIIEHLESRKLINDSQLGFRSGRSYVTNLTFLEDSTNIIDDGGCVDVIYLDFLEAFDKMPSQGFLLMLQMHGICVENILYTRTCYFELRPLASIRRFLTSTATATLVSAFVLSRIDYCNSLLFGSTHDVTSHLQQIQNYAARVILRLPMSSRITIHLKSLHWLSVKVRSTYKIACLCYHCHSSTAPSYVTDMLHKKPLHTRNTRSSSYTMPLLNRPAHSKATLGDRSFSFASSSVWNSILNDVRCAPSLSSFKSRLKTYLFHSVYKD